MATAILFRACLVKEETMTKFERISVSHQIAIHFMT